MTWDRLCFGTSTFVAGRLHPDKNSLPGIDALRHALVAGLRLIHTNPQLQTQWAVRHAVDAAGRPDGVRHVVKTEAPLDTDSVTMRQLIGTGVEASLINLGVDRLHAVVVEIDLKRTGRMNALVDSTAVRDFYAGAADSALASRRVDEVVAYVHSPAHLLYALGCERVTGIAAQYNMIEAWPALYLDRIATSRRSFIGMAPLRRAALAPSPAVRRHSLLWALSHPAVSYVVITMSSVAHLTEILADIASATDDPLPSEDVLEYAQMYCGGSIPIESTGPSTSNSGRGGQRPAHGCSK